jgi:hypothetical protein
MDSDAVPPIHVHALLICRSVEPSPDGALTLQNVVEIVPVESLPGQVGPLTFVAFVRNLPEGPLKASFLLRPAQGAGEAGSEGAKARRYPLQGKAGADIGPRQVALQLKVSKLEVTATGWYEVVFEWDGKPVAWNRLGIGLMRRE